jgi:hypothetical protein
MYYHKDDPVEFIRYLAEKFPRCFFSEPSHRRPLKRNIIDDLNGERTPQGQDHHTPAPRTVRPLSIHYSSRYGPAIAITGDILTEEQYASLRPALATTALREIIGKAEKLISSLQREEG